MPGRALTTVEGTAPREATHFQTVAEFLAFIAHMLMLRQA